MPTNSEAQAILKRTTRTDRRLARQIRNEAAASMGLRRGQFMRLIAQDDEEAVGELKLALAESEEMAGWEFDPERFGKFLEMIISFIKALMAIFGGL